MHVKGDLNDSCNSTNGSPGQFRKDLDSNARWGEAKQHDKLKLDKK